jgi:peptidoglycan/LPS O-acetylase OafA/YrhL
MWSLAIEEQFYLTWPILLVLLLASSRRRPGVALGVIGIAAIASMAAMALEYRPGDSSRAYFGTDGRAHVLLIGAALAFLTSRRLIPIVSATLLRGVAVVAVVCVGATFVVLDDKQSAYYRGGAALFALCVATLLFAVEAQPGSGVARALSARPMTWAGRISYSLYLWHWPIIIWTTSFVALSSSTGQKLLAIALTVVAASASYYFVEAPVRFGRAPGSERPSRAWPWFFRRQSSSCLSPRGRSQRRPSRTAAMFHVPPGALALVPIVGVSALIQPSRILLLSSRLETRPSVRSTRD